MALRIIKTGQKIVIYELLMRIFDTRTATFNIDRHDFLFQGLGSML